MSLINLMSMSFDSRTLCAICDAPATGCNFDAYTCLSCKAFFRRNAYNDYLRSTCRVKSCCQITIKTRRHCAACRLNKCFSQGMKKELIRSLVAINKATTFRITQKQTTIDNLFPSNNQSNLLLTDWNLITNIRNAYENYCIQPFLDSHQTIPLLITTQPYRSRFKLQRLVDLKIKYLSIINSFIKRVFEFDISIEKFYEYIKDNLKILLTINTSELMKSNILKHLPWENDQILFETVLTKNLIQRVGTNVYLYQAFLPYDPVVTKLFLIILALTSGIYPLVKKKVYYSYNFQPFPKEILHVQNYYITILWKYIIYRFGYKDAIMYLIRFIQNFLHRQIIENDMIDIIENRDDHGQFSELMERTLKI